MNPQIHFIETVRQIITPVVTTYDGFMIQPNGAVTTRYCKLYILRGEKFDSLSHDRELGVIKETIDGETISHKAEKNLLLKQLIETYAKDSKTDMTSFISAKTVEEDLGIVLPKITNFEIKQEKPVVYDEKNNELSSEQLKLYCKTIKEALGEKRTYPEKFAEKQAEQLKAKNDKTQQQVNTNSKRICEGIFRDMAAAAEKEKEERYNKWLNS